MSSILKIEKVEGNLRQTEEDTQAEEGKAVVKTMAETGVMWPKAKKAKEFQQPQKLEEGRERYSPRAFRESTALPRPWFQTSDFYEPWESKFLVFQATQSGTSLQQPREPNIRPFFSIWTQQTRTQTCVCVCGKGITDEFRTYLVPSQLTGWVCQIFIAFAWGCLMSTPRDHGIKSFLTEDAELGYGLSSCEGKLKGCQDRREGSLLF